MMMNKRHQVIAHDEPIQPTTKSKGHWHNNSKYICILVLDDPVIYLDKCCEAAIWFRISFLEAHVILEKNHMIMKYKDNSNGIDKARHALSMKEISKFFYWRVWNSNMSGTMCMKTYQHLSQILVQRNLNCVHP